MPRSAPGWSTPSPTPQLLKTVTSGKLQPKRLITHRFPLAEIMRAYDVFANAAYEKALKVILTA